MVLIPLLFTAALTATQIALAAELVAVAAEHCANRYELDAAIYARLDHDLHEYDIGGIASAISPQLNRFYEDLSALAGQDRAQFCSGLGELAEKAGYAGLFRIR